MRRKRKRLFFIFFLIALVLCVLFGRNMIKRIAGTDIHSEEETEPEHTESENRLPREGTVAEKENETDDSHLREDKSIYDKSEWNTVVTMYLTVRPGNEYDNTNYSWTEVNAHDTYYYRDLGIDRYACEAILQIGDENGPVEGEFGYGETVPNATVMVRGQTSSKSEQKNYKVRIKDGKGTYKEMQTIPLNKVQHDDLRFRNKMTFDLMQTVPQMTAIRTQFVHLYVKDETQGGSGEFEDYGLFSRLEQMNRAYLRNHGLDSKGYLYKINSIFEWYDYEEMMIPEGDPDYDQAAFENHLEIKGNRDNTKLREVLSEINNYAIPTEEIIEKYFDVENLSYYLAFHILDGNHDVGGRNMYIYSPLNSEKWYLLSWDCDGCFEATENELKNASSAHSWETGITKYTGVVLFNRFLRVKEYRDAVTAAVIDLKENYLSEEKVRERVETCRSIVWPYIHQAPDNENWGSDDETFNYVADMLPTEVEENYESYLENLEKPWPFFVGIPEKTEDGRLRLSWDASYDLDGELITYTCILANDPAFTDVITMADNLRVPELICDVDLSPGEYFIRVQATNESGYTQDCFDCYTHDPTIAGKRYGCKAIIVNGDGTIEAYSDDVF